MTLASALGNQTVSSAANLQIGRGQSGAAAAGSQPANSPPESELRQAAEAFEAIFLRQLLASARAADFGGEDLLGGPGLEQFEAMRDEHFADVASEQGMFGLAEAIERQLSAHTAPNSQIGPEV